MRFLFLMLCEVKRWLFVLCFGLVTQILLMLYLCARLTINGILNPRLCQLDTTRKSSWDSDNEIYINGALLAVRKWITNPLKSTTLPTLTQWWIECSNYLLVVDAYYNIKVKSHHFL